MLRGCAYDQGKYVYSPPYLLVAFLIKFSSCVSAGSRRPELWSFYLAAMLFDCLTLSISTVYLLRMKVAGASS